MAQKRTRRSIFTKVLLFQLILTIILLILADLLLWVFAPLSAEVIREKRFTQNLPGLKREIIYRRDGNDLRSLSPVKPDKPDNLIRVLCLGASTTEQSTQETGDTWCGILEANLLDHYKDSGVRFQTMAFGSGGDRAVDTALWLKDRIDKIKPDIIITLLGVNDLCWNGGPGYKPKDIEQIIKEKSERTLESLMPALDDKCSRYSQIYRRMSAIIVKVRNIINLRAGRLVEWHSTNLPDRRKEYREFPFVEKAVRDPDPIDEFRLSVKWLVDFLGRREVPVIVLGQPVLWEEACTPEEIDRLWFFVNTPEGRTRPAVAWLHAEMQRYNLVQESLARERKMKYVDLDRKIPKTLEYFFDDCHYTDLGSRQVAQSVLPALIESADSLLEKRHSVHARQ
ncbi:MAG: GDSL-type esterase/lipase family protein [Syntrophobacteraceae bacterium]